MKLVDALFCDDIRQEVNNKVSLMGLYNDRIVLHTLNPDSQQAPFVVSLSTLLRFSTEQIAIKKVKFEFKFIQNKQTIANINGEIDIDSKNFFTIAIRGSGLPLKQGDLGFSIKMFDKNHEYLSETRESVIKVLVKKV